MKTVRIRVLKIITICVFLSWAAACQPQTARDLAPPTPSPESIKIPTTMALPPLPASTPEVTDVEPSPSLTPEQTVYVFSNGLSVESPEDWMDAASGVPGSTESVWFRSGDPSIAAIGVEVAHRPLADRAVTDPFTWVPNEGGYEIHWSQPVVAAGLDGLLFVWGVQQAGLWDSQPWLMAVFYDDRRELDIRLTTEFTVQQLELATTAGLAEAVTTSFPAFKRMLESLKFVDSGQTMTITGVIRPGADLGMENNHCAEGLYLVAEDGFLIGQISILLLRVANPGDQPALFSDQQWNYKYVSVSGKYPAQDMYCEALLCECEDYILVDQIEAF